MPGRERDITLDVTIRARTNEADRAAAALGHVDEQAKRADGSFAHMSKTSGQLQVQIDKTRQSIVELGKEYDRTGDSSLFTKIRKEQAELARLTKLSGQLAKFAVDDAHEAGRQAGKSFSAGLQGGISTPGVGPILVAGLVGATAAAAPTVGAILGGALAGATGTAAMAAGILAAAQDPRVRDAAGDVGETISHEIGRTASAFVGPTIAGLHILQNALDDIDLPDSLAKLAPTVTVIAKGLGMLAINVMPGLNKALDRMGPFADTAARGLAQTGEALGQFFDDISANKGSVEGLAGAFNLINGSIRILGGTIHILSGAYEEWINANEIVLAELEGIAIATGHVELAAKLAAIIKEVSTMRDTADGGAQAQQTFGRAIDDTTAAIERQRSKVEALLGVYEQWFGIAMGLDEAQLRVKQGMLDFQETLKENGRHWEDNTKAGLANQQALLDQIRRLNDMRLAQIAAGQDAGKANAQYDQQVDTLLRLAGQAGLTKTQLDRLKGSYEIQIVVSSLVSAGTAVGKLVSSAISQFWGGQRAAGGPVVAGVPYTVNERGSETVTFPANGQVHPASLTPVAAPPGPVQAQVSWAGTGMGSSEFERMFVPWMLQKLRVEVRALGGAEAAFR